MSMYQSIKMTNVAIAILLMLVGANALKCHYCDEYSKDNKCEDVEVSEECDENDDWCEVEWADNKMSTKQCSDVEALPAGYIGSGALKCKEAEALGKLLLHCFCQEDNCNKIKTPPSVVPAPPTVAPQPGTGTSVWVGVGIGCLVAILATIGGCLGYRCMKK
eukprot:TRINITY_DN24087_c0_g1_i1.p1 TRINITY_DN24087_c0_g1~~TRINITY_DN24087_c0_g1_i1.p1  ORF type:complete len:162 (-),score=41.33 TRINITY_DN24087_c0_g1_i1:130-615(-)